MLDITIPRSVYINIKQTEDNNYIAEISKIDGNIAKTIKVTYETIEDTLKAIDTLSNNYETFNLYYKFQTTELN